MTKRLLIISTKSSFIAHAQKLICVPHPVSRGHRFRWFQSGTWSHRPYLLFWKTTYVVDGTAIANKARFIGSIYRQKASSHRRQQVSMMARWLPPM